MKVTFNIQNKKAERSIIVLSVHWDGMRYQISTGQSILVSAWDDSNKKVKRSYQNAMELNRSLNNLKVNIEKKYLDEKNLGHSLDKDEMKAFIKELINPSLKNAKTASIQHLNKTLMEYFDEFIEVREKNQTVKIGTIKKYKTARAHLTAFQKSTKKSLQFEDINKNFSEEFVSFLNHKQNLNNNSASSIIRIIKTFLHWATDRKYNTNIDFIKALKVSKKDGQGVALTFEELEQLQKVELTSKKLIKVRDLFLMQIYTGLRFSDLDNLKPENFDLENNVIKIHMLKTEDPLIVPISDKLLNIISKYPDLNFPKISNQKYNDNIKELCKVAAIDKPVPLVSYYGTKREENTYPKYQLISSHTARRTFITLSLKKNILPEMIMKVSGHKNRNSFQKYVKIAQDEAVEAVRNAWG